MDNIKSTFIRKRNNNYNVIVEYYDEAGKIKQKSIAKYGLKKKAERHLIELKAEIQNQKYMFSNDITVTDRCYRYINENKRDWSPYTVKNRLSWVKLNVAPFFKDTKMENLTIHQIQRYLNYLYENFTVESAKTRFGFFRSVVKECYRMKEIKENLCDFVKSPKKEASSIADVYTREEILQLFKLLEDKHFELPILLIVLLGLRKGEAYGLTWDDIDFDNNTVKIEQISIYLDGSLIFKSPKTTDSKRLLSAPIELMNKLKKEKLKQNELKLQGVLENKYNLVCLNKELKPYKNDDLNRYYRKFCKENNFRQLRIHDLRHTNATLLLLSGTDMKTVSGRLGHTDIKITMNKYSHVLEEMDRKASENLSNILFNQKSTGN
nr:site-specific integrase [uncultured Terrisporobacter sp.]